MKYIKSLFNVGDIEDITLDEIVSKLGSQEMLGLTQAVRNAKGKEAQDALKLQLPLFTLCNVTERVDNDHFIDTKYLIYDVDGLSGQSTAMLEMEKVRDFALFAFVSPRGCGFKFVIELDKPVKAADYRFNYRHYYEVLSAETGLKLDPAYHSLHTFFGYLSGIKLNPKPRLFPAISGVEITAKKDVDVDTIDPGEIKDVCEYLSHRKLNYMEWTQCAFALQNVKDGEKLFALIQNGDKHEDHKKRIPPEEKFKQCSNPKDVTVATLFWIAYRHKYERKAIFTTNGKGCYCPFTVLRDGMYYMPKDGYPERVFGFRAIEYTGSIVDPSGNKIVLKVDGKEIIVKAVALSSSGEFRKAIQSQLPSAPFMLTNGKKTALYDMLFNYLDKTKSSLTVQALPGVGNVGYGIWNFGSIVYAGGKVLPYDSPVIIGEQGFVLDDVRDMLNVTSFGTKNDAFGLIGKLSRLHKVYKEYAATAIGWAASNIYFSKILSECGGFPIMFLYGQSSSGKSKLANIILAMFGVRSPETSHWRVSLASGSTATAMSRVKDGSAGIPQFFDEYGTARDGKARDTHFQLLKGLFDGVGKTMAKKTNDNQVHRMEIASGTIFASVDKECREEAINRCIYVDMNGVKDTSPEAMVSFQQEFMSPSGLQALSAFAINVVCGTSWGKWWAAYSRLVKYIGERAIGVDSRVVINWAIVGAGYALFANQIKKELFVPDDWWVMMAQDTSAFVEESDAVSVFLGYVYMFACERRHTSFIKMVTYSDDSEEVELSFNVGMALTKVREDERKIDGLIHITPTELGKRLLARGAKTGTQRFKENEGASHSLYCHTINYIPKRS